MTLSFCSKDQRDRHQNRLMPSPSCLPTAPWLIQVLMPVGVRGTTSETLTHKAFPLSRHQIQPGSGSTENAHSLDRDLPSRQTPQPAEPHFAKDEGRNPGYRQFEEHQGTTDSLITHFKKVPPHIVNISILALVPTSHVIAHCFNFPILHQLHYVSLDNLCISN